MKKTALHVASEAGHASIVTALLTNAANYDALDCEGQSTYLQYYNAFTIIVKTS